MSGGKKNPKKGRRYEQVVANRLNMNADGRAHRPDVFDPYWTFECKDWATGYRSLISHMRESKNHQIFPEQIWGIIYRVRGEKHDQDIVAFPFWFAELVIKKVQEEKSVDFLLPKENQDEN
jgi:hypothetical protein